MPFDAAATQAIHFAAAAGEEMTAAFDAAGELDAAWAVQNPEKALAFLMVSPSPCAALDALTAL